MSKKTLIFVTIFVLVVLFGGWLLFRGQRGVWNAPKEPPEALEQPIQSVEKAQEVQLSDTVGTSNWKTYRNEEYGFEVKYPEGAEVETFYSNGIGSPVDCKKTPEKCLNFSIKIQNKKGENLITMETFPKELPLKNDTNEENSGYLTFHRRGKTVSGNNYTKSNSYFPMFSSCFTVVSFSDANLRKNDGFHFFKFYEIQGETSLGDAKMSCAKENKDVVFDEIIGSFRVLDVTDVDTSSWKTYRNEALKLGIKYPSTFKLDEEQRKDGHVVSFMEFDENARDLSNKPIPGYFSPITVFYWKDINNSYLKGGEWEGEKKYKNFQDFIADSEHTYIKIISETNVDGTKAYVLSMPGDIGYEAVMFEYSGGYYRISFPWTQKPLNESIKKEFLSSIKLLK